MPSGYIYPKSILIIMPKPIGRGTPIPRRARFTNQFKLDAAEIMKTVPPGKGSHSTIAKGLRQRGYEIKESINGLDVRRGSLGPFTFFAWPKKK